MLNKILKIYDNTEEKEKIFKKTENEPKDQYGHH